MMDALEAETQKRKSAEANVKTASKKNFDSDRLGGKSSSSLSQWGRPNACNQPGTFTEISNLSAESNADSSSEEFNVEAAKT